MEGLNPNPGRLKAMLLSGFAKGVGQTFCNPTAQLACQRNERKVVHGMEENLCSGCCSMGPDTPMAHENLRKT